MGPDLDVLLEQRRVRDAQLTALFETANDLASLQDVDAVLRSIVAHARRLLHADLASLSLVGQEGRGTHIRVASGAVSARLQDLRLDLGVGIGGLVATSRAPVQTADYAADPRLRHEPLVDDAVAAEGLVAILGVPLLVSGELIGVLLSADRAPRVYRADEVALLSSLATHAALAIEKTRLLQEAQDAVAELHEANELLRLRGEVVERAAEAHERLTDLVLRGGGVADVAAAVVGVLGGTLAVLDVDGSVLAQAGPAPLPRLEAPDDAHRSRTTSEQGWLLTPVVAGQERLGLMLYAGDGPADDSGRRIVERAALVTALLLVWRRSVAVAEVQGRGEVLRDVLGGTADAAVVGERARVLGVDLDVPSCVVVLRAATGTTALLSGAARAAPLSRALVGEFDGDVVVVTAGTRPREDAERLVQQLTPRLGVPVTAGAAGPASGAAGVRTAYGEARRCAGALVALGRAGEVADSDELGFLGLLLGPGRDAQAHVRRRLGPLLDHDAARGSDLVGTLEAWFAQAQNLVRTARVLHLHPNTVSQRLERVDALLGRSWRSPRGVLEVQLALELLRVTRAGVLE